MTQRKNPPERVRKVIAFSEWLYRLFLHMYPGTFRHTYGLRMAQVFRDNCRDIIKQRGVVVLIPFWLHVFSDLISSSCSERWHLLKEAIGSMATTWNGAWRIWSALIATICAFFVSLIASLNLYLLEDSSPLTLIAYSSSPLLRFSYDLIYLSALAAGVAMCAVVASALLQRISQIFPVMLIVMSLVAAGGFGGLLLRHPGTFLIFFVVFLALILIGLFIGRGVAAREKRIRSARSAAILGACMGVCCLLLINGVALILHTLLLNPVSHALYMQGQIPGTHFNFSLIAMLVASLTLAASIVSLTFVLRVPSHQS